MQIFTFAPEGAEEATVTAWLSGNPNEPELSEEARPAIIICPGGGYQHVSKREAEPVAKPYFHAGYQTFILNYTIGEGARNFRPLCQLAATIAHIRKHATEWKVAADQIAVCGFSAGGHLAASLGTLFHEPEFLSVFGREENIRPDAMVLGYPVITSDAFAHVGSIESVSGAEQGTEEYEWFGLDRHVDSQTPPTFLWHTAEDGCVPVENSLKMAMALSNAKVPYELHILPQGCHGMSVCTKEVDMFSDFAGAWKETNEYNSRWIEWSIRWMNRLFDFVG